MVLGDEFGRLSVHTFTSVSLSQVEKSSNAVPRVERERESEKIFERERGARDAPDGSK